jgi:Xaa-Pro dipeptidase
MNHTESTFAQRIERVRQALAARGFDGLVLNPGPSFAYLTGLPFHLSERPAVLMLPTEGTPSIALPAMEEAHLEHADFEIESAAYTEDLATWGDAFAGAAEAAGLRGGARLGVEPRGLRFLELSYLRGALAEADFADASDALAEVRSHKDAGELAQIREAVRMAQDALEAALKYVREGMTELDLRGEIIVQLLRHGSGATLPFDPLVSFGASSSNPHAHSSTVQLKPGDLILVDWGANNGGYFSDLTRMFAWGEPEAELMKIVQVVQDANAAGREAAKPGATAGAVDDAARGFIKAAGYGDFFLHRTGHGLGLEVHEEPYLRAGNDAVLRPGMTFTVEPGIYLAGRGGARIEDDMVITEDGSESLSTMERSLRILG